MSNILLKYLPPHKTYIEVFGGSGGLLFAKEPSPVEVYNDFDDNLTTFFSVLRDEKKFKKLYKMLALTPYSRADYRKCFLKLKNRDFQNDVERAYCTFIKFRMAFSGKPTTLGWSYSVSHSCRKMASAVSRWLSSIDSLPEFHLRLSTVQIENLDFRKLIPVYDYKDAFFYLDPPYVKDTRKNKNVYLYEMEISDHEELVSLLLNLKGKALLSGYDHSVYEPLEKAGWNKAISSKRCSSINSRIVSNSRPNRIECLWFNYSI